MKQNKFLYFRTIQADVADDSILDSVCYPASSLMGMAPISASVLGLFFKSIVRGVPSGNELDDVTNFDNHDIVLLDLTTNNTHLQAMTAIVQAINDYRNDIIIVANDDSDSPEYLANSGIASVNNLESIKSTYDNA